MSSAQGRPPVGRARKDASEGAVQGDPVRQCQERGWLGLLLATNQIDLCPAAGTAEDGPGCHRENVPGACRRAWGRRGSSTSANRETRGTGTVSAMGETPGRNEASHPTHGRHYPNWNAIALAWPVELDRAATGIPGIDCAPPEPPGPRSDWAFNARRNLTSRGKLRTIFRPFAWNELRSSPAPRPP